MKTLETLRQQLSQGEVEFSRHAFRRAVERNISEAEIRQAGANAEIIEDYPDDKYSPSCLLLGFTENRRPLHIQISFIDSELVKIITLYEPYEANGSTFHSGGKADMFQCHVCGAKEAHQGLVNEVFLIEGKYVLVEGIPARVCARCGEVTFSCETTERIRRMVHGEAQPVRAVPMEVFAYA